MSSTISLSAKARVYLQHTPPGAAIIVLPPGATSVDEVLSGAPKLHATLTHDEGVTWPDAAGCQLAQAAADNGGFVALQFETEADARVCLRRLRPEADR